ncbi:hypothetical protein E4T50_13305 [Aureobasidium sp. EXF-12298]|nr:hypothetical protein E4T50_13305 [Aureobasidium sp. EXF-12298]KAI4753597.1 hypothetical protein E4T51_13284 [Aureobasidium sp. EXF-12344]KAI4770730.1 hypothetical protein E4T52_14262 [Aureobasidium sp. EXF-3400]
MCGQTLMVYECICDTSSRELMPPRICKPACEVEKSQLMIELKRPCSRDHYRKFTTALHDKPLPGIPAPGPTEGQPPTYQDATEQPPTYDRAISEEEPATYDNVITAMATFQPEEILRAWHTFRATQLSLLPPLLTELQALEHRVFKAKRRLHRAEDIGFCEEVIIRLAREQHTLDKSLQQGQRYLDATLVLKYGLDKYQTLARQSTKLGDYAQAGLHVKAASEHADRLLEMKVQLSRPEQQSRRLAGSIRQQLYLLEKVVQTLEARTTTRVWAFVQVATRSDYDVHC